MFKPSNKVFNITKRLILESTIELAVGSITTKIIVTSFNTERSVLIPFTGKCEDLDVVPMVNEFQVVM